MLGGIRLRNSLNILYLLKFAVNTFIKRFSLLIIRRILKSRQYLISIFAPGGNLGLLNHPDILKLYFFLQDFLGLKLVISKNIITALLGIVSDIQVFPI